MEIERGSLPAPEGSGAGAGWGMPAGGHAAVLALARWLDAGKSRAQVLGELFELASDWLGARRAVVFSAGTAPGELRAELTWPPAPGGNPATEPPGVLRLAAQVALTGQPLQLTGAEAGALAAGSPRPAAATVLCVTLPAGGPEPAAIYVECDRAGAGDGSDLQLLAALAGLAGLELRSGQLAESARDRPSRGRAEARHRAPIVGESPAIRRVLALVERMAASTLPVLLQGATGTGKELVARAIHAGSPRCHAALVTIDCGAMALSLAESEIFGYRRGAFTDARRDQPGLIERADGGTLFLDEIGDTSMELQAKLLRFLQESEVRRIGDTRARHVDVRVIAASNRDLRRQVADGRFREDLLYRLDVVRIELPALVERREDIPLLASHFLETLRRETGKPALTLAAPALARLLGHTWPGNVRELENTLRRAAVMAAGEVIEAEDLPPALQPPAPPPEPPAAAGNLRDQERAAAAAVARRLLADALEKTGGDVQATARLLGTPLQTVYYKLGKLGITPNSFRKEET